MENYIFQTRNLVFQDKIYYNDISIPANKVNFIVGRSGSGNPLTSDVKWDLISEQWRDIL